MGERPKSSSANGHADSLSGHALGNLLLTALTAVAGGIDRALAAAGQVLAIRGQVLPVTLKHIRLQALLANGRRVVGEPRISRSAARIERIRLLPSAPPPSPGVFRAIRGADLIVLGPGSLYTSVIPPLLVRGVARAVAEARALKIYVCNVMTQPGETDAYSACDHLRAVLDHCRSAGRTPVADAMLVNSTPFPPPVLKHYARFGSYPVPPPAEPSFESVRLLKIPLRSVRMDSAMPALARHSPERLALGLMALLRYRRALRRGRGGAG